jgi:N-acetylmuramoyl-L-alanine amidase
MRDIKKIIVHCSDTYSGMDVGVKEIDKWHKQRGWSGIGYHYIIRRNGDIEKGRDVERVGAHVRGHNYDSIGVCWVGGRSDNNTPEDNRTEEQKKELKKLVSELKEKYKAKVFGHHDFDDKKACPCFNVKEEYYA